MKDADNKLKDLHASLDRRWRPEDVVNAVIGILPLNGEERTVINVAVNSGRQNVWSSMSDDFKRPVDMSRQLKVAQELFGTCFEFRTDDLIHIEDWIKSVEATIGKQFSRNDFKSDRLPKSERKRLGIDISRRQYNKRFRLAARLEAKAVTLAREQFKRSLALASKNRLASRIGWEDFSSDANSACFIAYYVARCNLRSVFTNSAQVRPYDEICEMLMERCRSNSKDTNWWAIAHVLPTQDVLQHLDDEQKGVLLASFFNLLRDTAEFLRELWNTNEFDKEMIVRRGNDSTTWNVAAGAWNKLRDGWFSLLFALGMQDTVDSMCFGKVMRLMAADVASWHRQSGGGIQPDTFVWNELPRPWEIVCADASCTVELVKSVCQKYGVDPSKSGWIAPKPSGHIQNFTPTPELVHGVIVESPLLAAVLRKAGVFSGQQTKRTVPLATVEEIRRRHFDNHQRPSTESDLRRK